MTRGVQRCAGVECAVLIETIEDGTVVAEVERRALCCEILGGSVEGGDTIQSVL